MVRKSSEQTIPHKLIDRISDLRARFAAITQRLELDDRVRQNAVREPSADITVRASDYSANPIEFVTENGFTIIRPWETKESPAPAEGKYRFRVSDPVGYEREITIEISNQLVIETNLHNGGRLPLASSFWTCCAERHLADYVSEYDGFPDGNKITVQSLNPEDVLLAIRWGKPDDEREF
jgi:hypothetical protein